MPRLRLRRIDRRFGGTTPIDALKGVCLQIEQGEFIAIEGDSGGGKSTLLNIIGLLDEPTGGSYSVGEVEIALEARQIVHRADRGDPIFQLRDAGDEAVRRAGHVSPVVLPAGPTRAQRIQLL